MGNSTILHSYACTFIVDGAMSWRQTISIMCREIGIYIQAVFIYQFIVTVSLFPIKQFFVPFFSFSVFCKFQFFQSPCFVSLVFLCPYFDTMIPLPHEYYLDPSANQEQVLIGDLVISKI